MQHISLRGKVYVVSKLWRTGEQMLVEVQQQKERNFDYMSVDSVLTAYSQYGIVYECNGDFTSIHKTTE